MVMVFASSIGSAEYIMAMMAMPMETVMAMAMEMVMVMAMVM